jgi:hypothetical protein
MYASPQQPQQPQLHPAPQQQQQQQQQLQQPSWQHVKQEKDRLESLRAEILRREPVEPARYRDCIRLYGTFYSTYVKGTRA